MTRRVSIQPDTASTLHVLRCVTPCAATWCMRGPDEAHAPHCYLGGYGSPEAAREAAARHGYEVVE